MLTRRLTSWKRTNWLTLASFSLALLASLVLLLASSSSSSEEGSGRVGGLAVVEEHDESLVGSEGWGVLLLVFIPVLVAASPLALMGSSHERTAQIAASVLLLLFGLLGAASVGLFYLPSVLVMALAAVFSVRATRTSS